MRIALKENKAITLVALVITIVVLIILASITINMTIGNDGIFTRAKEAKQQYINAQEYEQERINALDAKIARRKNGSNAVTNEIVEEEQEEQTISASDIAKIKAKYLGSASNTILTAVDYTPQSLPSETVQVPGNKNGGATDQSFTQANTGAIGATSSDTVKWYVLQVDKDNLTLVSSVSNKDVTFRNAAGYDNCLYYLNQIATRLFKNEAKGVTADRVHAFRLTDLRDATKALNNWNESDWNTHFVNGEGVTQSSIQSTISAAAPEYNISDYTKFPAMYGTTSNIAVTTNNPLYDEMPGVNDPMDDSGIGSRYASSLTVNATYFGYDNSTAATGCTNTKNGLGTASGQFGDIPLASELFNTSGMNYWLASRCVRADANGAWFFARGVYTGYLYYYFLCSSSDSSGGAMARFRVVVSVPASHVNVANDGTINIE